MISNTLSHMIKYFETGGYYSLKLGYLDYVNRIIQI
jgi:hypothetical protein